MLGLEGESGRSQKTEKPDLLDIDMWTLETDNIEYDRKSCLKLFKINKRQ